MDRNILSKCVVKNILQKNIRKHTDITKLQDKIAVKHERKQKCTQQRQKKLE